MIVDTWKKKVLVVKAPEFRHFQVSKYILLPVKCSHAHVEKTVSEHSLAASSLAS